MSRLILASVAVLAMACGPKDVRVYDNSLFQLGAGFNARMVCTCLYVHGRDVDACTTWTRVQPDLARFKLDEDTRTVTSRVLGGGKTVARFIDAQVGCQYIEE